MFCLQAVLVLSLFTVNASGLDIFLRCKDIQTLKCDLSGATVCVHNTHLHKKKLMSCVHGLTVCSTLL